MTNSSENRLEKTWATACVGRLNEQKRLLNLLRPHVPTDELWVRPGHDLNGIGHLLQHIKGNMSQYILHTLGAKGQGREREKEFQDAPKITSDALFGSVCETLDQSALRIEKTLVNFWSQQHRIQTFEMSALEAVMHSIEHTAYHIGQIALLVKQRKGIKLSFYPSID